jgi:hypothetical protein
MPESLELHEPSLEHRIRLRAYDLYAERGKIEGHAIDDWLQAEKEILQGNHWPSDWRLDSRK